MRVGSSGTPQGKHKRVFWDETMQEVCDQQKDRNHTAAEKWMTSGCRGGRITGGFSSELAMQRKLTCGFTSVRVRSG